MPEGKILTVRWTNQALENATSIKSYLLKNFTKKELESFYSLLKIFEDAVSQFPQIYPVTNYGSRNIRRAVLSKVLSVFYSVSKNKIEVLAILDNRCDISKWLK